MSLYSLIKAQQKQTINNLVAVFKRKVNYWGSLQNNIISKR